MFSVPLFSVLLLIHHHLLPHQDSNHPKVDRSALSSHATLLPSACLLCSCFCLMLYSIWRCSVFCSYSYKSRLLLLLTAELSPRSEKPATSLVRRRLSTPKTSLRSSKTTPLKGKHKFMSKCFVLGTNTCK